MKLYEKRTEDAGVSVSVIGIGRLMFAPNAFGIDYATAARRIKLLTFREMEVAGMISLGIPHRKAAKTLGISICTYWIHLSRVRSKLETTTNGIARIWYAALMNEE